MHQATGCTVDCAAHGGILSGNSPIVLVVIVIVVLALAVGLRRRRR